MPAFHKRWFYRSKLMLMRSFLTNPQPRPLLLLGKGSTLNLCSTIAQFGLKRPLIVTDKPLRELGVLDAACAALESHGLQVQIYDGVLPDPTAAIVNAGIARYRQNNCDSVLAFGGGSSIDCAKVVALAAANNCSAEECIGVGKCKLPSAPLFAVPTTAGTGSEATFIAVISDDVTHEKGAVIDAKIVPRAAALDPELMQGLPPHITAATGMDALTHAIESYIGTIETEDTNYFGLAASKLIFDNLAEAYHNGENLAAREAMSLASYYGGLAITNALVGYVHAVSHNLGARYGVPHGLGNAMVLPHVLELLKDAAAPKLAKISIHCGFGQAGETDADLAQKLIDSIWRLNKEIGIPATTDIIKDEDIEDLVNAALAEGSSYPTPRYLESGECRELISGLQTK
ncbi:MAG: alcohol dehydrogenase [Halieaceae bacterium]|jgi:alcohol dehydrogenase